MDDCAVVSVVVRVYKVEKYIDECVKSLANQTYSNIETILVDDGSPDNCPAMYDAWEARDSRIKVIHKPNGGLSDARNSGIQIASRKWLLFIDSDDVIPVDYICLLVTATTDNSRLVVSGKVRFSDDIPKYDATTISPQPCPKNLSAKRGGFYYWGTLYGRALAKRLDLQFDISLRNIEDAVWNGIYLRYISEVIYVDIPYFYRMNPTSITSKCGDYEWQVASWITARRSIMNWFADKQLTREQRKEATGMYRHCQNNIHAECVAGNISYAELHAMECDSVALFD